MLALVQNAATVYQTAKTALEVIQGKALELPNPTDPGKPLISPEDVHAAVQAGVEAANKLEDHADAIDARLAAEGK